jgi:hypothetical protein
VVELQKRSWRIRGIMRIGNHTKKSWETLRRRGLKRYILNVGVLKLGIFTSSFVLILRYLAEIDYEIELINYDYFLYEYLIWFPVWLIIGVIIARIAWEVNNNKLKKC